ncbi:glycoside hydrolase family 3 N-terminal domain-containing protein [Auraticoccus monumenti]|uniref:beta-N-acetylhexosaminidase n=1 Tax=Auraticoccus monumenti TaxID=675864 RepID=A0A1G7F3I1_9ACTN|nr:glycoside hydrolase family 3 N-terminal domain-containing protein [Auraticoccus monumenti]SDE70461.1 beta-N-acetylhexosaminidase [Auraticoccus monumenti]
MVTCRDLAAAMGPEEQAGQLLMVGISANQPASAGVVDQLDGHHISSILLLENTTNGVETVRALTDRVREELQTPDGVRTLVAADQEGGQVQRLQGPGFSEMPPASEQAGLGADGLESAAEDWGGELADAGVDLDLAPVADVVPAGTEDTNAPIGQLGRGYGSDPDEVSALVRAFVRGMDAADVATSVKHFPGIGAVEGNTDFTADVVDSTTTADGPEVEPFAAAVEEGVDAVMVSTVTYTEIAPDSQAVFSEAVVDDLLRDRLGFEGVVVSDDMGVAEAVAGTPVERRLVDFVRAGGDLAITADPTTVEPMVRGLLEAAEDDPELAEALPEHVARVLSLKAGRGLADCEG